MEYPGAVARPCFLRIAYVTSFSSIFAGCGLLLSDQKFDAAPDASAQTEDSDAATGNSGVNGDLGVSREAEGSPGDAAALADAHDTNTLGLPDAAPPDAGAVTTGPTSSNKSVCRALGSAACTCDMPDGGGDENACNESVGEAVLCCAASAWPSGGTCSCLTAECTRTPGGGCSCSPGTTGDTCNDGAVCCVQPGSPCLCTYGITECWTGYQRVAQCDGQAFQCSPGQRKVRTCNVPR